MPGKPLDEEETIYLQFPLWTLAISNALVDPGLPDAILRLKVEGLRVIVTFTEELLSEQFLAEHNGMPGIERLQIESPASLHEWHQALEKDGVTHVIVDATARSSRNQWAVTLEKFFSRLPTNDQNRDSD